MGGLPYAIPLIEALQEVRTMLMPFYGNVSHSIKDRGNAADVVTELDYAAEDYLRQQLMVLDPSAAVVGEERGGDRNAKRKWFIDPIDGTGHFARGMPFCTTMLALVEDGEVTASFIYDFVRDELYRAERGRGATCNGMPLHVSDRSLGEAYVSLESRLSRPRDLYLRRRLELCCVSFHTVCAGYQYAMIACGKLDGRICFDPYGRDYDFAPGMLLVAEAGGRVANIGSRSYDYRNVECIAANPKVFEALTEGPKALFPIREPSAPR